MCGISNTLTLKWLSRREVCLIVMYRKQKNGAVPIGMSQVLAQWVTSKGKVGDPRMELLSHVTIEFPCLGKKIKLLL